MEQSYGTIYFQRNENASVDQGEHLVIKINELLESSRRQFQGECCIYEVPYHLRKLNEEAYTPQVISIGPFHHGNEKLKYLEGYKVRYLDDFMRRAKTNLENLVGIVKGLEQKIRQCYAETFEELDSDEFVKMILHDAAFIIEYFLRFKFPVRWTDVDRKVIQPWRITRMQLDFLLLENQLPFFVLNDLYQLVLVTNTRMYCPFIEVASHYFKSLNTQNKSSDSVEFNSIFHFVDLIRIFYLPPPGSLSERQPDSRVDKIYCATQLAEAGLSIKKSESPCHLKLKYEGGVLEIPRFTIDNTTEIYARNLMALEQCQYPNQAYITDYFLLLDFLIDTGEDVALLAKKKILVNGMGDDINATFVNNLGTNVQYSDMNDEYVRLCGDLVKFHDNRCHRWKAMLKRDYFSNPWRTFSTITAIFLLVFTLTQAVCSLISVLHELYDSKKIKTVKNL